MGFPAFSGGEERQSNRKAEKQRSKETEKQENS
jgi:hypothetical protein